MFGFKRRRRRKLREQAFPEAWLEVLRRNVPHFGRLEETERKELLGHIHVFLGEKHFEGCGGLELTDEIRLTVAGHACVLLLNRETDYYPRLDTVLVYPQSFVVDTTVDHVGEFALEGEEVRDGEAWQRGVVILAWDGVLHDARTGHDGFNVAFHEFAHQLDMENGEADGCPELESSELAREWGMVFGWEYEKLNADLDAGRPTLIDEYGAEDPAEFFAVLTELFLERPRPLRRRHPDLYRLLSAYYRQDPAERRETGDAPVV